MKNKIQTRAAPKALGPYSQAVKTQGKEMLFISGQIGVDPKSGQLAGTTIETETRAAMENLQAVLHAAGHNWDNVVKVTIFLTDLANFSQVNDIYGEFVKKPWPARACVQVAALPKNARIEIEAISVK